MINCPDAAHSLSERVHSAIAGSPYLKRNKLQLHTQMGCVTLKGEVGSYYQKQMAQEAVLRVDGVDEIENLLEVNWA